MLVQFSFNNFKCFKDEVVLNLTGPKSLVNKNYAVQSAHNYSVLRTAAVYGANASGKTKLFSAFELFKVFISPPKRANKIPVLDYWMTQYDSFRMNTYSSKQTSFFEAVFIIDGIQYRYGVELNQSEVIEEWLYMKNKREINLFTRSGNKIKSINKEHINLKIANNVISADMISSAASFLAVLSTFNEQLAVKVVRWFDSVIVISANDIRSSGLYPIPVLDDEVRKKSIVAFLKAFDINIEDVNPHEINVEDIPDKIKALIGNDALSAPIYDGVITKHRLYNDLYEPAGDIWMSMEKDESFGTNRLFGMSWAIISALRNGTTIFIDEFDSGIHPIISKIIVELFYKCNPRAQLIINTHNSSLLHSTTDDNSAKRLFDKNQVFVVNKNRYGESSLIPFTDFKNIRSNMETLYLDGMLSGVPYISTELVSSLLNCDQ